METDETFGPGTKPRGIASRLITEELAYLRAMHVEAQRQAPTIIANSIASDIADLVRAQTVIERLERERDTGREIPTCQHCGSIALAA